MKKTKYQIPKQPSQLLFTTIHYKIVENYFIIKTQIKIKPNAKKTKVFIDDEKKLNVVVDEAPVDGKANERLVEILSDFFLIPKKNIHLISGETSKLKTVQLEFLVKKSSIEEMVELTNQLFSII